MLLPLQGEAVVVDAGEQLPDLIGLRFPADVLEIHDLSRPFMGVNPMRTLLALEDKAESLGEPA